MAVKLFELGDSHTDLIGQNTKKHGASGSGNVLSTFPNSAHGAGHLGAEQKRRIKPGVRKVTRDVNVDHPAGLKQKRRIPLCLFVDPPQQQKTIVVVFVMVSL